MKRFITALAAVGNRRRPKAPHAPTKPKAVAPTLSAMARSIGRSASHISFPSTARVAHASSSSGSGNTIGLASIHAPRRAPPLRLRFQIATKIRGALSRRVQALQGLEWRLKTFLVSRSMNDDIVPSFDRVSPILA